MDLDDLIAAQRGVVSRAQALAAGLTPARLRWLVERAHGLPAGCPCGHP